MTIFDTIAGILFVLALIFLFVFIGFTITFFIGLVGKYKNTKRIGLIGLAIMGIATVLFFGVGLGSEVIYNHQQEQIAKENEKEFSHYSKEFKESYIEIAKNSESVANYIGDQWKDKMDDDDFDVDKVVESALEDKVTETADIKDELDSIENTYTKVVMYADKSTAKKYKSAYSNLKDFADLATNPRGSYSSYVDKFNDLDDKVATDIKEL